MRRYRRFLGIAVPVMWLLSNGVVASAQEVTKIMRWDILTVKVEAPDPKTRILTFGPGGTGSPQAIDGAKISLTGSGTFSTRGPKEGPRSGFSSKVSGGGTWETFDNKGNSTGKGTYKVVSLVRYVQVPGRWVSFTTPSGITIIGVDTIGDLDDARGGVGVFRVEFTDENGDESQGLLTVNCFVVTSPGEVQGQEGVAVIKGFVNYFRINGGTFYHIIREEDEEEP